MDFAEIYQRAVAARQAEETADVPRVYISATGFGPAAAPLRDSLDNILREKSLAARVIEVGSFGICYLEPVVCIALPGRPTVAYGNVTPALLAGLVPDCISRGDYRPDLAFATIGDGRIAGLPEISGLPFFQSQSRIALRHCGYIAPANINQYIARGGYAGLAKALKMPPAAVAAVVKESGLRGWGGSLAGDMWLACLDAPGEEKSFICYAGDGDSSDFAAGLLLESDPHAVLEGLLIGAYAAGASRCYLCVNKEYRLALARLQTALEQMLETGFLGENILGSGFGCRIEIREIPGSAVSREEPALLRTLDGRRGVPCPRPPDAAVDNRTAFADAATLAAVSAILEKGAAWYAGHGTAESPGTMLLTLGGKVKRPGVIEVPLGATLRRVIYDIGGGVNDDKEIKAVMVGGFGGGFLPEAALDTPLDYRSLAGAGIAMASGSLVVADSATCVVDLTLHALSFSLAGSCGHCVPCREGTLQMTELLKDITGGRGKMADLDLLMELGDCLQTGSLCRFGKNAPAPVLTSIAHFRDEYAAHIAGRHCPAGVCRMPDDAKQIG